MCYLHRHSVPLPISTDIGILIGQSVLLWISMNNTLTVAEIKRRGMAAIEEGLRRGPVHIVKRNKPAAVVLSEDDYLHLTQGRPVSVAGMTAVQWLLAQPAGGRRSKAQINASLSGERSW